MHETDDGQTTDRPSLPNGKIFSHSTGTGQLLMNYISMYFLYLMIYIFLLPVAIKYNVGVVEITHPVKISHSVKFTFPINVHLVLGLPYPVKISYPTKSSGRKYVFFQKKY